MFGAGALGQLQSIAAPYAVNVKNQPELRMWLVLLDVPRKKRTPFAGDAKAKARSSV